MADASPPGPAKNVSPSGARPPASATSGRLDRTAQNLASNQARIALWREREAEARLGGGAAAVKRQHERGRMTARERIAGLVDPDSEFFELAALAAWGMYAEWGGAPAAGVITGLGRVSGHLCVLIANDATVKAGAFFPSTAKKVIRAQTIALDNHLPVIYLVDSAGVFLPLQEDVFPDTDDFGRVFRNNAVLSARGIPQLAAIMGSCVAGGAYLPVMCDAVVMSEGSGLYLAGPALVQSAIGQKVSSEELGGAAMHAQISGTVDFREPDDAACLRRLRELAAAWGPAPTAPFARAEITAPRRPAEDLLTIFSTDPRAQYDVRDLLACLLDDGLWDEYRAEHGRTLVCGWGRWQGWAVGIVANQRQAARRPDGKLEFGGVIYPDSADKAARFILACNQARAPLIFLHDVSGFMVGREAESEGIIRAGAKMVNAVANASVPKISLILGGSFGAGHYAMCGRAYDPRFLLAWPMARYAVMGAEQAAQTLLEVRLRVLEKEGKKPNPEEQAALRKQIQASYEEQAEAEYGAARLWLDAIIDPLQTRSAIGLALDAAAHNPEIPALRTGVLQT